MQSGADSELIGIGVIIADPYFEQVAEDVQRLGAHRVSLQKAQELVDGLGRARVEVYIRYEQTAHARGLLARVKSLRRHDVVG